MGIAALVLGIVGVVIAIVYPAFGWVGAILGIVGIILGALGRKNPARRGIATAGLVLSIVSVALCVVFWLACAACVAGLASM